VLGKVPHRNLRRHVEGVPHPREQVVEHLRDVPVVTLRGVGAIGVDALPQSYPARHVERDLDLPASPLARGWEWILGRTTAAATTATALVDRDGVAVFAVGEPLLMAGFALVPAPGKSDLATVFGRKELLAALDTDVPGHPRRGTTPGSPL